MQEKYYDSELNQLMNMLHTITKMDIRHMDNSGAVSLQISNHKIPVVLHQPDQENEHIQDVLRKHKAGSYYHFINPSGLEYMAANVWRYEVLQGSIVLGPFLSNISTIDLVRDIIANNLLPISERNQLEHFYEALPTLSDIEQQHIGKLLAHLCTQNQINAEPIANHVQLESYPVGSDTTTFHKAKLEENKLDIEQRYDDQNEFMDAITKGDKPKITRLLTKLTAVLVVFSNRVPGSPIRSSKNMGFVLNTMCRIAAERGGVHPVYLHHISERFAIQIEKTFTIPQLKSLYMTMALEYCDLVTNVATGQFSTSVKKALDYIQLNLGHSLHLQDIAEHVHLNPSHLSRKFKEETGLTITDFINHKRIEEAAAYLRRGNMSITEAAFLVGFNDLNYFSKVFKKLKGMTPSQYVKG